MQSKVSVKGQTVIPREIRKALGITSNTILYWKLQDGIIRVYPVPANSVKASLGLLKNKGISFEDFLKDRQEERIREKASETGNT